MDRDGVPRLRGTIRFGMTCLPAKAPAVMTLAVMAFAALVAATTARTDEVHPWCMVYQEMTGAWSCAFTSFEQCRASAAGGNGGSCIRNPAYQTPPKPAAPGRQRR